MFKPKTLLVLGAGASFDLNFPLGAELKSKIKDLMERATHYDSDSDSYFTLAALSNREFSRALGGYELTPALLKATEIIRGGIGFSSSVDNFLVLRSGEAEVVRVAKAAIAWLILEAENACRSKFAIGKSTEGVQLDDTWYQPFAEICFSDTPVDKIEEALSRFSVVSFNYDRCFEVCLRRALEGLYSLDSATAAKLASLVQVVHPYGSLGELSRVEFGGGEDLAGFRAFAEVPRGIKTFGEGSEEQAEIRTLSSEAQQMVFLGFGFHRQNVELFKDAARQTSAPSIFATAKGLPRAAQAEVTTMLAGLFLSSGLAKHVSLSETGCRELLEEYRIALTD